MAIPNGFRLGSYEVISLIGVGGMGEVYRAHDARLGRDVAIKILPSELTTNADRLARLEREARALAATTHPNIATIHGIEDHGEMRALVMELVDGEMLAERIARVRAGDATLPLKEVLTIARQIAAALEAAHDRGIVHRDLKPANIKVNSTGAVKVLDFGLAKAADSAGASGALTLLADETRAGVVLGTAAYMSPEQARGQAVDRRTDIWAFGCVLYEMLTGVSPFAGEDATDTLAHILRREPNFAALPAQTPEGVRRLLSLCLEKDRAKRLAQIAVAGYEIDASMSNPVTPSAAKDRRWAVLSIAVLAAASLGAAAVWLAMGQWSQPAPPVTRLFMGVAPAERIDSADTADARSLASVSQTALALSPDGKSVVFSGVRAGQRALYVRRLNEDEATPISGTNDGIAPFFSPDGRWIGYWSHGVLRKVALAGGPPIDVATTANLVGASWGDDDRIVFARAVGALLEVSAAGGTPTEIIAPDETRGEASYRLPQVLPGSDAILFTVTHNRFPRWDQTQIYVYSRADGVAKLLIDGGADARYLPSGHILYAREGVLLAAPFDVERLEVTAGPIGVVAGVMQTAYARGQPNDTGAGQFAVSGTGTLAYIRGGVVPDEERSLLRVDRTGRVESLPSGTRPFITLRLSPDGQQVALSTSGRDRGIWFYSLARETLTKLPVPGRHAVPIWTPDGQWITLASGTVGVDRLYRVRADGSSITPELIVESDRNLVPGTWARDGGELFYYEIDGNGSAIRVRDLASSEPRSPLSGGSAGAGGADLSPDGRWLAYHSTESGQLEVYVQAYPGPGSRYQVSTDGGMSPIWRADGRELFYARPSASTAQSSASDITIMAVAVSFDSGLQLGEPDTLFEGAYEMNRPARAYDVSADGAHFFLLQAHEQPRDAISQIVVVQNWFDELEELIAAR
jgi:serine/threonine-protein kinase